MDVSTTRKMRRTSGVGILCGCVGIAGLIASYIVSNWYEWTPASFPISLRPGVSKSQSFRLNLTDSYQISLKVKRVVPPERLRCILGIRTGTDSVCAPNSSVVKIRWSVLASGGLVAYGESEDDVPGTWGDEVERPLGTFRGEKGAKYVVTIVSVIDGSELDMASPRVVVGVHPISYKSYAVVAQGLAFVSVGVLVLCVWLTFRSRNVKKGVRAGYSR